jgi:hypothetical protein
MDKKCKTNHSQRRILGRHMTEHVFSLKHTSVTRTEYLCTNEQVIKLENELGVVEGIPISPTMSPKQIPKSPVL